MNPRTLDLAEFPCLDLAEVGHFGNLGYGKVEGVRAPCIVSGVVAELSSPIGADDTVIMVEDVSRFQAPPFIAQVGYELMRITNIAGNILTVERGYGDTTPKAHGTEMKLYESLNEYVYLLSLSPIKSVNNIYVDSVRIKEGFTAYTGQVGDSHPDWAGMAVVAFTATDGVYSQLVLPTEYAAKRERGQTVEAVINFASHPELHDSSDTSFALLSDEGTPSLRMAFSSTGGMIKKHTYTVTVKNSNPSASRFNMVICDSLTREVLATNLIELSAEQETDITVEHSKGNETFITLVAIEGDIEVYHISKKVLRKAEPSLKDAVATINPPVNHLSHKSLNSQSESSVLISTDTTQKAWVAYSLDEVGDITEQTHYAEVNNPSLTDDAVVEFMSVEPSGLCHSIARLTIGADASETLSLTHESGTRSAMTKIKIISGSLEVIKLLKSVTYTTAATEAQRAKHESSSARIVLGDDVTVDGEFMVDVDGSYGGLGQLIQSPEHVIKHFIVNVMGFDVGDIDGTSFSSAGTSYASAVAEGYKFGFVLQPSEIKKPSDFLRSLARQCRSAIKYSGGKWKLDFIPSSAPSAVEIISDGKLAGEGSMMSFRRGRLADVANSITAMFRRNYSAKRKNSRWLATSSTTDAASILKYGTRSGVIELPSVRDEATAVDVLGHVLNERKIPLLRLECDVFYEHFNLDIGDTVEIDNPLYGGRLFYIESIRRVDRFRGKLEAIEWG